MLKEPLPELEGKNIALVAMGQSQIDYHLSRTHSLAFDEVGHKRYGECTTRGGQSFHTGSHVSIFRYRRRREI